MKSLIVAAALLASSSAFAQTLVLRSGEEGMLGSLKIICQAPASQQASNLPVCTILGAGNFNNKWVANRVSVENNVVFGSDDTMMAARVIENYRANGVCQSNKTQCKIIGAGNFNNSWFGTRIVIGDSVIYGSDDHDKVISTLARLKSVGACGN